MDEFMNILSNFKKEVVLTGESKVFFILDVVNKDAFDHFAFDSLDYAPFHNDPRVLVCNKN
jgi:hypothetical protein